MKMPKPGTIVILIGLALIAQYLTNWLWIVTNILRDAFNWWHSWAPTEPFLYIGIVVLVVGIFWRFRARGHGAHH